VVEQVAEGIDDLCRSDIMRTDDDFVRASHPRSLRGKMLREPVAIEPTSYRLLLAFDYPRNYNGSAQSSPSVCAHHLEEQTRTDLMHRGKQKVVKPQFFEAFRKERDNYELLNTAAGYIAKKGVLACTVMALKEEDEVIGMSAVDEYDLEGRPWGGMLSKTVLAVEMIPMMIKIQAMSRSRFPPP
jgi:cell cycle checkpoint protein